MRALHLRLRSRQNSNTITIRKLQIRNLLVSNIKSSYLAICKQQKWLMRMGGLRMHSMKFDWILMEFVFKNFQHSLKVSWGKFLQSSDFQANWWIEVATALRWGQRVLHLFWILKFQHPNGNFEFEAFNLNLFSALPMRSGWILSQIWTFGIAFSTLKSGNWHQFIAITASDRKQFVCKSCWNRLRNLFDRFGH